VRHIVTHSVCGLIGARLLGDALDSPFHTGYAVQSGFIACREGVPDLWKLGRDLEAAVGKLEGSAELLSRSQDWDLFSSRCIGASCSAR
jgi:hypothetical protein